MIHEISVDAAQQFVEKKVLASSSAERQAVVQGIAFEKIYLDRAYDVQRELVQLIDAQHDIIFDAQGFIILYNTLTRRIKQLEGFVFILSMTACAHRVDAARQVNAIVQSLRGRMADWLFRELPSGIISVFSEAKQLWQWEPHSSEEAIRFDSQLSEISQKIKLLANQFTLEAGGQENENPIFAAHGLFVLDILMLRRKEIANEISEVGKLKGILRKIHLEMGWIREVLQKSQVIQVGAMMEASQLKDNLETEIALLKKYGKQFIQGVKDCWDVDVILGVVDDFIQWLQEEINVFMRKATTCPSRVPCGMQDE